MPQQAVAKGIGHRAERRAQLMTRLSCVVRTPSVIVDALLGQGEALDCYNQQLQAAAYDGAHLANLKLKQAMAVIDAIADPAEKARLYNHVFGTCCPTPQTPTEE